MQEMEGSKEAAVQAALNAIGNGWPLRAVAREFGVPRTTLQSRLQQSDRTRVSRVFLVTLSLPVFPSQSEGLPILTALVSPQMTNSGILCFIVHQGASISSGRPGKGPRQMDRGVCEEGISTEKRECPGFSAGNCQGNGNSESL